MGNNIYSVKQAAKILGLSTNTTYKYLNEGRIKAARGHIRGTFIITRRALENFLGGKLPDSPLTEGSDLGAFQSAQVKDAEAIIEVAPPTLATKVVRILITLCLLLIIVDIIFNKNFSPISQIGRLVLISLIFVISYQFGGFIKK
jgi:excisionase family DNA binding protein